MSKFRSAITAYSAPRYDTVGVEDHWDLGDWLKYHEELTKELGKKYAKDKWGVPKADEYFLTQWRKQTLFSQPLNQIQYPNLNKEEFQYMDSKAPRIFSGTGAMTFAASSGFILKERAVEIAKDIGSGFEKVMKILKWTLIIGGILVVVGVSAYAYNAFFGNSDNSSPKYK